MREHGFVTVETPYLTRSTPEGARDFLVPVRLRPATGTPCRSRRNCSSSCSWSAASNGTGSWPAASVTRTSEPDRQPEFTQVDIEMSFVTRDDVITGGEDMVGRLWAEIAGYDLPRPIPRMTYAEAMDRFVVGQAGPAVRLRAGGPDRLLRADGVPRVPGPSRRGGGDARRGGAVAPGAGRLAGVGPRPGRAGPGVRAGGRRGVGVRVGPRRRHLSEEERAGLLAAVGAGPGELRVLRGGRACAGQVAARRGRLEIGHRLGLIDPAAWAFTWVVDAPMFEEDGTGGWTAVHHPFTAQLPEWADKFAAEPGGASPMPTTWSANGTEIGGGSIRHHRPAMQQQSSTSSVLSREEAQSQFGFLLDALRYGPPPHGGIASAGTA